MNIILVHIIDYGFGETVQVFAATDKEAAKIEASNRMKKILNKDYNDEAYQGYLKAENVSFLEAAIYFEKMTGLSLDFRDDVLYGMGF